MTRARERASNSWPAASSDGRFQGFLGLTGPGKGKGGKYLILGPGQEAPTGFKPDYVGHSATFNIMSGTRILSTDPAEAARILGAVDVYPAKEAASPRKTRIVRPEGLLRQQLAAAGYRSGLRRGRRLNSITLLH